MSAVPPYLVEAFRCRSHTQCQEYSLVLTALGIAHQIDVEEEAHLLLVAPQAAARATAELEEYEAESQVWPPPSPEVVPLSIRMGDILGYWFVLILFYSLETRRAFSLDWLAAGKAHAELIRQGEWWRTVTALTLHADGPHLLNNLLFGSLFALLLGGELGIGLTWFAILLSGALGNGANAWLHSPDHRSIGASTAVFGAIGLLVALQWKRSDRQRQRSLRRWAPPAIGAVILGYLGTAGERTDVLAHVVGMVAGSLLGLLLNLLPRRPQLTGGQQLLLGLTTLVTLAFCWSMAFRH